jgi:spore coat protein U-like protein
MKKPVLRILLVVIAALAIICPSTFAATATGSMTNTVTITNNCTISATGFTTTYDPVVANLSTDKDVTATVSTTCTINAAVTITLGQGANANTGSSDAAPLRRLSDGAGTPTYLNYALYTDSSRTLTWGNTLATGVASTGAGAAVPVTVYARIPMNQTGAKPGTYTDTVVATVTY